VLPGLLGTIQAIETIKLILDLDEPLLGRLLLVDALSMRFRELKLRKDPSCVVCGPAPGVTKLIDYESFCGIPAEPPSVPEISVAELKGMRDRGESHVLVDVREPHEVAICAIEDSLRIPLAALPGALERLSRADDIVVHCRTGVRSAAAARLLLDAGFARVRNLSGGIRAWAELIDPGMPRY
jgi:adenylyltransferase/sulfurtransferase